MRRIRELNNKLRKDTEFVAKDIKNASFDERRSGLKDRRKLYTFIMDDRRSGIAERRKTRGWTKSRVVKTVDLFQHFGAF